ncbi:MAG: dihydrolipoamide acetyltransferase family protein [Desulfobacterales bacterium]|jgi:pyruvate dehydrogenase E2 component (dihydrolipoamide acetyltransferase)
MARSFKLPDLGEGIHEGEVIAVLVETGDDVKEGDPILEVETDKASVEIPSPFTGTVQAIKVKAGDVVKVGDLLMTFSDAEVNETEAEKSRQEPDRKAAGEARQKAPPVKGTKAADPVGKDDRQPKRDLSAGTKESSQGPVPASPATRRLARELGVDLRQVTPSGPGGLVTAEDVRVFAKSETQGEKAPEPPPEGIEPIQAVGAPPSELPDFTKWGTVERLPLRSIRKATARQMALAWSQIPHVSSQDDIDVTRLEALRQRHKQAVEKQGGRLTLTVFAVKAAAAALKQFPQFNVSLDVEKGDIIRKLYRHVGVATDTGEGLVVPVLRDADRKSIAELAVELRELVERTRARKVDLSELQGGTFTITNIGAAGGRGHFAPIINYPEAAILGMGAARLKPVIGKTETGAAKVVARMILPVVLAIDHRVLDGVDAARFLEFFRSALENPEKMLLLI